MKLDTLIEVHEENCRILKSTKYVALTLEMAVCVEFLRPSQPNGVMPSAVSLPNHTFTGQA